MLQEKCGSHLVHRISDDVDGSSARLELRLQILELGSDDLFLGIHNPPVFPLVQCTAKGAIPSG